MSGKPNEPPPSAPSEPSEPSGEDDAPDYESWLRDASRIARDQAPVPLPRAGMIVGGKYKIEEQLGRGGMGAVYQATHTVSGKQVALKWMLRPASDERAKQRYMREARAAGRIDHPNVVDIYDLGEEGDAGYLVMELLRGESLRSLLARGPLSPTSAVDLLLPAMRGAAAAHRVGVIHRDLKPDNIFLCRGPDGGAREAKVLDFGISAIHVHEPDGKTSLTKEGALLGTPSYMSPEQLASSKHVDASTDVYAFGVILYEALTGALPFSGDSYSALVLAIANTLPRPPRELCPELPAGLDRIVLEAMSKDPAARPKSMDALIAALAPYASAHGSGSGDVVARSLPAARARGPKPGSAVMVAVLLLSGGALWAFYADERKDSAGTRQAVKDGPQQKQVGAPSRAPEVLLRKRIDSTPPGASVVVGGEIVGVTPYVLELPSAAAELPIVLQLAGYSELRHTVLRADPEQLSLRLDPLPSAAQPPTPAPKRPNRLPAAPALAPR